MKISVTKHERIQSESRKVMLVLLVKMEYNVVSTFYEQR